MLLYLRNYSFILLLLVFETHCQDRVHIDVQSDIPNDGSFIVDCDDGYQDNPADFNCEDGHGGDFGGKIDIPASDLNGETGFWTKCSQYTCVLKYTVRTGDTTFKARVYQRYLQTEVSYDGVSWEYVDGEGWVTISKDISGVDKTQISLRLDHFSPDMFTALDKLVVNGDFEESSTTTTSTTTTTTTPTTTTTTPTTTTTTTPTTTTTTTPTTTTTTTPTTTTTTTPTTTTTTPTTTTSQVTTLSSTISIPSTTSAISSTTNSASTSASTTPTSMVTSSGSTAVSNSASTPNSSTRPTTTTTIVKPNPPDECLKPPCSTTTEKSKSSNDNFFTGLWGIVTLSAVGLLLLLLLLVCCLRCCCVPGKTFGYFNRHTRLEETASSKSSIQEDNPSQLENGNANERYAYMYQYPYLLTYPETETKPKLISVPDPKSTRSSVISSENDDGHKFRAVYRSNTPIKMFVKSHQGDTNSSSGE